MEIEKVGVWRVVVGVVVWVVGVVVDGWRVVGGVVMCDTCRAGVAQVGEEEEEESSDVRGLAGRSQSEE